MNTIPMGAAAKARVLFVDDEPRVLTSMRMQFRGQYEMFFAESGPKALEFLQGQSVDVIVSDSSTAAYLLACAPQTVRCMLRQCSYHSECKPIQLKNESAFQHFAIHRIAVTFIG